MKLSHITNRIEQQFTLMDLISNAVDNVTKVGMSSITSQRVQARLSSLRETWDKFSISHEAIRIAMNELNPEDQAKLNAKSYFSENLYTLTHESYLEAVEKMNILLDSVTKHLQRSCSPPSHYHTSSVPTYTQRARLPKIDIPKFNGNPSDWLSFKDLFTSMVSNNPTLGPVEKLQYLKTSFTGSAAHRLKNTTITANNFQKAWEASIKFYENKRLLVDAAFKSLLLLKRMTKESSSELELLFNDLTQLYESFETLERPVNYWDDFLVFIAVQKLDSESVKVWEQNLGSTKEPPTWPEFIEFLFNRLHTLKAYENARGGKHLFQLQPHHVKSHYQGKAKDNNSNSSSSCSICSATHYTSNCPQYTSKTVQQRLALITKHKLCYNCLGRHRVSACRITKRCHKCGRRHHTTIHQVKSQSTTSESGSTKSTESSATTNKTNDTHVLHSTSSTTISSPVLLATAQVIVMSHTGERSTARALIDQGSEISLISECLVQRLKLQRRKSSIPVVGIGAQKSCNTKGTASFRLRSSDGNFEQIVSAHILPRLTSLIPSVESNLPNWPQLEGLKLADPDFTIPGPIDLILGADLYGQIIEDGIKKGDVNTPIAQLTKFGWIISGPSGSNAMYNGFRSYHASMDRELHIFLQRFWELEEVPSNHNASISTDDQDCEQHFKNTHSRDAQGRYIVKLPFKKDRTELGDSRGKAVRIMKTLSKKFESDPQYAQAYSKFMNEYKVLHHMTLAQDNSTSSKSHQNYYLPHHGVIREQSQTTKLRVVFNGSSRTTNGVSLNDLLHSGAKLQIDLFDVLIWFRQFCYVFSSDIEKMYRQIKVHPDDWDFQRIVWTDQSNNLLNYQLTTVTYGLACAPFLALRTLKQLLNDEGEKFPLASQVLNKGRYVDDIFGGADTIQQAQNIVKELNQLCMAGGFPLQKWASNHPDLLLSIPQNKQVTTSSLKIEEDLTIHVLGLCWNPLNDTFQFTFQLSPPKVITKRAVLSTVAKIFDPLGLLSPITIKAKIFIQELWSIKLDWDDPLPEFISTKWTTFVEQLQEMPNLTFPR